MSEDRGAPRVSPGATSAGKSESPVESPMSWSPEFVAIGHVTLDRFGEVTRPGGAALYAAVTAHRLGLSAAILTSHGDDFPLELLPPRIEVVSGLAAAPHTLPHPP